MPGVIADEPRNRDGKTEGKLQIIVHQGRDLKGNGALPSARAKPHMATWRTAPPALDMIVMFEMATW